MIWLLSYLTVAMFTGVIIMPSVQRAAVRGHYESLDAHERELYRRMSVAELVFMGLIWPLLGLLAIYSVVRALFR